jgi:hypothetical protein
MTDARHAPPGGDNVFGHEEPPRDERLAALIADVVGVPPFGDVDWTALAQRIATARARQRTAWWSYATRWERRAVPVALAAGLAGVLALWGLGMPTTSRATTVAIVADPVAAMLDGTPTADAARNYARTLTGADDLASVEAY